MSPEQLQQRKTKTTSRLARQLPQGISTVSVVGLGYVGLPLSLIAAARGYHVIGFDIDDVKVAQLARREANFLSESEEAEFKHAKHLSITSDERMLIDVDAFLICVPTPVNDEHEPNLAPLISACTIVGRHLSPGALVVVESTVNPGVCEEVALATLSRVSGLNKNEFDFAHCPERINPGDKRYDVATIPRVIGGATARALERASKLYESFLEAPVMKMDSIKEAEAVKMIENAFRDINIAFVNELAVSFDRVGIDIVNVIRGASTKPFGFMPFYPGCGVGGHCIPVDPHYLIRYGREHGFEHTFLLAARRINSRMPHYCVHILEQALREQGKKLRGSTIALLGVAYKRDVPDTRESPAAVILDELVRRGAIVRTFDPYVASTSARTLPDALKDADAALIATDHSQFCYLAPQFFEENGVTLVIDGRNCLDKDLFADSPVVYRGIGRSV
ncbi:MAG TPA: nucleotide sugar dehydrogenase [Candidatus Paceibacterota bacterium]|nr:nucleotide sugar dehydrogenase [Candidatus Paceibacterota bacterium]